MMAGCYTLHLYCEHPEHSEWVHNMWPAEYTGESYTNCLEQAKSDGFTVTGTRPNVKILCPYHTKHPKLTVKPKPAIVSSSNPDGFMDLVDPIVSRRVLSEKGRTLRDDD